MNQPAKILIRKRTITSNSSQGRIELKGLKRAGEVQIKQRGIVRLTPEQARDMAHKLAEIAAGLDEYTA